MTERLITDTCSVVKLVAIGDLLFATEDLPSGKLVIHPRVHSEIRKWSKFTKKKYASEIEIIKKIKSTPDLRPPAKEADAQVKIIKRTADEMNRSVGAGDIDQLLTVIYYDYKLVTNDDPMSDVAKAFDVEVFEAEEIALEAFDAKIITKQQLKDMVKKWNENEEKKPQNNIIKKYSKINIAF